MSKGEKLLETDTRVAELATLLIRACRLLDALVGSKEEHRRAWMESFNRDINAAPKDAILSAEGLVRVVNYLEGAHAR